MITLTLKDALGAIEVLRKLSMASFDDIVVTYRLAVIISYLNDVLANYTAARSKLLADAGLDVDADLSVHPDLVEQLEGLLDEELVIDAKRISLSQLGSCSIFLTPSELSLILFLVEDDA